MHYERPAIERRMPVSPPVIEGGPVGSVIVGTPVWERPATDGPEASPEA